MRCGPRPRTSGPSWTARAADRGRRTGCGRARHWKEAGVRRAMRPASPLTSVSAQPARILVLGLLAATASILAGTSRLAPVAAPATRSVAAPFAVAAPSWCLDHGGALVERFPVVRAGADDAAPAGVPSSLTLCEFPTGRRGAGDPLAVDLATLYGAEPTLAAVAIATRIPTISRYGCLPDEIGPRGERADVAWVARSGAKERVLQLCVFADGSAVDAAGLAEDDAGSGPGI